VLANYGLLPYLRPLSLGLWYLGGITGKGQCYGSPKNGLSEANYLTTAIRQSWAMLQQNYCVRRPPLETPSPLMAAVATNSQATVLAHHFKPFSGLRIMKKKIIKHVLENRFSAGSYHPPCIYPELLRKGANETKQKEPLLTTSGSETVLTEKSNTSFCSA
jgi:hypothetical protein